MMLGGKGKMAGEVLCFYHAVLKSVVGVTCCKYALQAVPNRFPMLSANALISALHLTILRQADLWQ